MARKWKLYLFQTADSRILPDACNIHNKMCGCSDTKEQIVLSRKVELARTQYFCPDPIAFSKHLQSRFWFQFSSYFCIGSRSSRFTFILGYVMIGDCFQVGGGEYCNPFRGSGYICEIRTSHAGDPYNFPFFCADRRSPVSRSCRNFS